MPNATPPTPHPGAGDDTRAVMSRAIRELDSESLRRAVLESHAGMGTDGGGADVRGPARRAVGDLWRAGDLSVLHEHHASQIVRSVVEEFRREELPADAPRVVLACPPGELHELPLHLFGLMLAGRGCSPFPLGSSTPWRAIADARRILGARVLVLSGAHPAGFSRRVKPLQALARSGPVCVAGAAASGALPEGIARLSDDWREAADAVARMVGEAAAGRPAGGAGARAGGARPSGERASRVAC